MMMTELDKVDVPDSKIITEAQDLVHDYGNELIWNHSNRVYLFGAVKGDQDNIKYDHELLYISALFHDLGLTNQYSSDDLRFEVDGANAARQFLNTHNITPEQVQLVWDAIALHTTPGVAEHKESEVALLFHGVGMDVMGDNFDQFSEEIRKSVVQKFPRKDFKNDIIEAFYNGIKHKPETTFGNMKEDVIQYYEPGYHNDNFCSCILNSKWDS